MKEIAPTPIAELYKVERPNATDKVVLDLAEAIHRSRSSAIPISWAAQQEAHAYVLKHGLIEARAMIKGLRKRRDSR